jgi:hypothetical protein
MIATLATSQNWWLGAREGGDNASPKLTPNTCVKKLILATDF